jgi:hypothetical protein
MAMVSFENFWLPVEATIPHFVLALELRACCQIFQSDQV